MQKKIQRVELNDKYYVSIHCPFCGAIVVDTEAAEKGGEMATPCPHTLFIAHDAGFEHRNDRVNVNLNIVGVEDDDLELPEKGIDGLTDSVTIADSVKFAAYVGPPSFFGSYVGFAPLDE